MLRAPRPLLLLPLCLLVPAVVQARPVAFKGAWSIMSENRVDQNEVMLNYGPSRDFAFGVHAANYRVGSTGERGFVFPELSLLVHRWVLDEAQANLYLQGGYGMEFPDASRGTGFAAAEGDYETRALYFSSRVESADPLRATSLVYARSRLGLAPYLAAFEGLHTWIILQAEHRSWETGVSAGPLLRFFYRNFLFELGSDWRGRWALNWASEL